VRHHVHGTAAAASRLLGRTGIFQRGTARALNLELTERLFTFHDLPSAFDGYRILHLTDLHLDNIDETAAATARTVAGVEADLCVITGDIRDNIHSPIEPVLRRFQDILSELRVPDGALGVLGNHDSAAMVEPLEALGIRMLINETVFLRIPGKPFRRCPLPRTGSELRSSIHLKSPTGPRRGTAYTSAVTPMAV
jgi:hypothetical protein